MADKAGFDEKTATRLVSAIRCRMVLILIMAPVVVMTLEDNEDVSEMQADEKIILAIADLDVPLIMGSRLKKLIKAIQEAAKSSWDWKREGAKKTRMLSYHLKNWSAWWYKLRIPAEENAGETVVSRLERQLSKHHIGGSILIQRQGEEKPQRPGSSARSLVTTLSWWNAESQNREAQDHHGRGLFGCVLGHTSSAWLKQASRNCRQPSSAETNGSQIARWL